MTHEEIIDLIPVHIGWPVTERPSVGRSILEDEFNPTVQCISTFAASLSLFDKVDVREFAEFCPICRARKVKPPLFQNIRRCIKDILLATRQKD